MKFDVIRQVIPDVVLIRPRVIEDERGYLMETYGLSEFSKLGISEPFVQDTQSCSVNGVLRGLHYQLQPFAQTKLIRVLRGEILDVAVDIRQGSPSYGRWVGQYLSAADSSMLLVPEGFAHGFCVLSDIAEVLYKSTKEYSPDHEAGICWDDPEIGIAWPVKRPVMSPKDSQLPPLRLARNDFSYSGSVNPEQN